MSSFSDKLSEIHVLRARTRSAFVVLKNNYLQYFKAVKVDDEYLAIISHSDNFNDLCTAVDRIYRAIDQELDALNDYECQLEQKNNEVLEMLKSLNCMI